MCPPQIFDETSLHKRVSREFSYRYLYASQVCHQSTHTRVYCTSVSRNAWCMCFAGSCTHCIECKYQARTTSMTHTHTYTWVHMCRQTRIYKQICHCCALIKILQILFRVLSIRRELWLECFIVRSENFISNTVMEWNPEDISFRDCTLGMNIGTRRMCKLFRENSNM